MLKQALNLMLSLKSRNATLERNSSLGDISKPIKYSTSNYSKLINGPSTTAIYGAEFLISREVLETAGFPTPVKRGDRIIDSERGALIIKDVEFLEDIGGEIIAYRVRTG